MTTYSPAHEYTKYITGEVNLLDDTRRSSVSRRSRNSTTSRSASRLHSTGKANPYSAEFLGPREGEGDAAEIYQELGSPSTDDAKAKNRSLAISFFSMVFVGLMNKVFNKLMTVPMHNYPNFLNLLTTFIYLPVCFSYIVPASHYGWIPKEQITMSKKPFAIMGGLDSLAAIMQIFATTFLSGPLVILLSQAAIPVSMVISRYLLKAQYNKFQYIGAVVVAGGIVVVLAPSLGGGDDPLWAILMILSTIPMALSSVYKEIALGETELDPIYLNGWVAVFQFAASLIICIPASYLTGVAVPDMPANMYDGLMCYFGISSYQCDDDLGDDCVSDACNPQGPIFVNIYIIFNQAYNLLIILILKYGSANILFMALTIMVPLGNIAFTLPFVPEHNALAITDIIGLIVIMGGLICYRFANDLFQKWSDKSRGKAALDIKDESLIMKLNDGEDDFN